MSAQIEVRRAVQDERRWLRWYRKPWLLAEEALGFILSENQVRWLKVLVSPERPDRLLIEAPPGTRKTTVARLYMLGAILDNPNERIIHGSVKTAQARHSVAWVRAQIESNAEIRAVYGDLRGPHWSDTEFTVAGRDPRLSAPTMTGIGSDTSSEGLRATKVVFDDPIDWTSMWSGLERQRSLEVVDSTVLRRIDTGGTATFFGGAWDSEDLYVHLVKNRGFHLIREPARLLDGSPAFPEALPEKDLARVEREDPFIWKLKYQLDREAQRGGWKWAWVEKWMDEVPYPKADEGQELNHYIGVDPALSPEGDYFALSVLAVDWNGIMWLRNGWVGHIDAPAQKQLLIDWSHDQAAVTTGIEAVQYQDSLRQHVVADAPDVNAVPIAVGRGSKEIRLNTLAGLFESGRLRVSRSLPGAGDTMGGRSFRDEFRQEYTAFPRGQHDDVLDSIYIAWKCIESGFSVGRVDLS